MTPIPTAPEIAERLRREAEKLRAWSEVRRSMAAVADEVPGAAPSRLQTEWADRLARDAVLFDAAAAMVEAVAVPPGYVVVPREPTEAMCEAGWREMPDSIAEAYRTMIAAAPPSDTRGGEG